MLVDSKEWVDVGVTSVRLPACGWRLWEHYQILPCPYSEFRLPSNVVRGMLLFIWIRRIPQSLCFGMVDDRCDSKSRSTGAWISRVYRSSNSDRDCFDSIPVFECKMEKSSRSTARLWHYDWTKAEPAYTEPSSSSYSMDLIIVISSPRKKIGSSFSDCLSRDGIPHGISSFPMLCDLLSWCILIVME